MFKKLLNRTTFIVGNKKNSGKTTFLNSVLPALRKKGRVVYLSIGVDGETRDQIFGFDKPRVFAEPGDHLVTAEEALKVTKAKYKVVKTFPYKTVLGKPKLVKITNGGFIELIGPENNSQLAKILEHLHKKLKVKTILVDGAINRITQVASFKDAQFVYICRVDSHRIASAAEEIKRVYELSKVKTCSSSESYVQGALTASKAHHVDPKIKKIAVEDFTKVFLSYKELVRFQRLHRLYFLNGFKLSFAVVNLFGVNKKAFLNELSNKKIETISVINEIGEC